MIAKQRNPRGLKARNSIVSGVKQTKYYEKGDTVVIHSNFPINFMGCTKDRVYKYEKIDHGLSHDIQEFRDNIDHPYEWIATINALYDLKVTIEKSYISDAVNLTVVYLLDKHTKC